LPDYAATGVKAQAFVRVLFKMGAPCDEILLQYQMLVWPNWHDAHDTQGSDR
jgi:hypothetical protein